MRGSEEIPLCEGYVADAVAISGLSMANERLLVGENYKRPAHDCADDFVFVFETKVSRADFFNTFKHQNHKADRLTPIGNFHFVVVPKGLLSVEEAPAFWGLLEQSGSGLRMVKRPEYTPLNTDRLHAIAYAILRFSKSFKFNLWSFGMSDKYQDYKNEQVQTEMLL